MTISTARLSFGHVMRVINPLINKRQQTETSAFYRASALKQIYCCGIRMLPHKMPDICIAVQKYRIV